MYGLARPFLFQLDAERAHALGLASLEAAYRSGLNPLLASRPEPLPTKALGLVFPNPVGLAAGLDKNGAHVDALLALGLRLRRSRHGDAAAAAGQSEAAHVPAAAAPRDHQPAGLQQRRRRCAGAQCRAGAAHGGGLLGINIGRNKDTPNESAAGRLPVLPGTRVSARRLHHRQHLLAQHRRPARTAGRTGAAATGQHAARGAGAARRTAWQARADAGEGRAGPVRRRHRCRRARARRPRRRRRHRDQHHGRRASPCSEHPLRPRNRRPVRRAADGQVHRRAAHAAHAPARGDPADRRRRHPHRRRRGRRRWRRARRWCSSTPA